MKFAIDIADATKIKENTLIFLHLFAIKYHMPEKILLILQRTRLDFHRLIQCFKGMVTLILQLPVYQ